MIKIIKLQTPKNNSSLFGVIIKDSTFDNNLGHFGSYDIYLEKNQTHFLINYKLSPEVTNNFVLNFKDFGGKKHYPENLQMIGKYNDWNNEKDLLIGLFVDSSFDVKRNPATLYKNYQIQGSDFMLAKFSLESFWQTNSISLHDIDLNNFYLIGIPIAPEVIEEKVKSKKTKGK